MSQRAAADPARDFELALQNAARFADVRPAHLRSWLGALVRDVAPEAESLGVRLSGDRAMRAINRDFRGRDEVTDVLSFPGELRAGGAVAGGPAAAGAAASEVGLGAPQRLGDATRHLGDIVVCVPEARRQARARGVTLDCELRTLLLHGVLHCMGYDHETDDGEMERLERRLRRRWAAPPVGAVGRGRRP